MRKLVDIQDQPALGGLPPALSIVDMRQPLKTPWYQFNPFVFRSALRIMAGRRKCRQWYRRSKKWLWNLWGG
jgi:hypothetical protein